VLSYKGETDKSLIGQNKRGGDLGTFKSSLWSRPVEGKELSLNGGGGRRKGGKKCTQRGVQDDV